MRRFVNLRIMLIGALGETVAIFILCASGVNKTLSLALMLAFITVLCSAAVIAYKKGAMKLCAAFVLCLIVCVLTNISFEVRTSSYNQVDVSAETEYTVGGYADSISWDNGYVKSIIVSGVTVNGEKIGGNVEIFLSDDEITFDTISPGYAIVASGKLYAIKLLDGIDVNGTAYRKDLRYKLYASCDNIYIRPNSPKGLLGLRRVIFEKLRAVCGHEYGAVAYCMLTGDKSELYDSTTRLYSLSGLGHVLAVSGLHVGVIVGAFGMLLGKLRVRKSVRVGVISALLVLFTVFAGMSASVIRASVMCFIGLLTLVNGQRKDGLSSLCAAYTLILVFEPFLLFEVGFLMSFSAVFGLVLFARTFEKYLLKARIPKFIALPLAATVAVHISIFPVTAYFFGTVNTYSILLNLLIVPFMSLLYLLSVICTPLALLFGFDMPLKFVGIGFAVTDLVVGTVPHLPLNSVYVYADKHIFLLYPAYFAASAFFMLPRFKRTVSIAIFALLVAAVAAPTVATFGIPEEIRYGVIPVNGHADVTTVIIDDKVTVTGDIKDLAALTATLRVHNIRKIDCLLVNRLNERTGNGLTDLILDYKVDKIVCTLESTEADGLSAIGESGNFYLFDECGIDNIFPVYSEKGKHLGYRYEFSETVSLLSVGYSSNYVNVPSEIIDKSPVIRCFMYLNSMPDRVYLTNMAKGYLGEEPRYQYGLADEGAYVFKILNGELIKRI